MTKEKKVKNIPKKGAARKWSQKLKEMGQQDPPKGLMDILNKKEQPKKIATPRKPIKDLDL